MDLLHNPYSWLIVSFLIFLGMIFKFGKGAILKMLDARIESIREEIKTAENLRIEAQELLAQYQRKHKDAMNDAQKIIKNAQKQAEEIQKQAELELDETLHRREKQLQERLERMKQSAKEEILEYASNLAIAATQHIIADKLDTKANEKLVDDAIKNIHKNIH